MATGTSSVTSGDRETSLLVTVVDVSDAFSPSAQPAIPAQQLTVSRCLDDVTTFLNSYLLLRQSNSVAVCLCHQGRSQLVYPVPGREEVSPQDPRLMSGKYEPLVHMNAILSEEIKRVMASEICSSSSYQVCSSSYLSGALSKCLCYIQRCCREAPVGTKLQSRLLVIRSSSDMASQYVDTMNFIFAAQKNKVPIDTCVLWQDSGFLQQASDITGGIYIKVPEAAGLLQFLIWTFLPDTSSRQHLNLPAAVQVDYRASCFCHHKLVDVGYVCSVCLSIYCQYTPLCSMCQAHFKLPNIPLTKVGKGKKKKNSRVRKQTRGNS